MPDLVHHTEGHLNLSPLGFEGVEVPENCGLRRSGSVEGESMCIGCPKDKKGKTEQEERVAHKPRRDLFYSFCASRDTDRLYGVVAGI